MNSIDLVVDIKIATSGEDMNLMDPFGQGSESSDTWGATPLTFMEYRLSQENIPIRIAHLVSNLLDIYVSHLRRMGG
jgi:hypothetical protein